MQIVINKTDLAHELALALGSTEKKTTIPVLAMVKLETKEGRLFISATDLENHFVSSIDLVEVEQDGAILLPAKRISEYASSLKSMAAESVEIKVNKNLRALFTCGSNKTNISGADVADFPVATELYNATSVPSNALETLFKRVQFAISSEESRFTLNGALLLVSSAGMTVAATDGHRLSKADYAADLEIDEDISVIVASRTLTEVIKLAKGFDGEVGVGLDSNHIRFAFGNRVLTSRRMTGKFPDYARILPDNSKTAPLKLSAAEFLDVLNRVSKFSDERSKAVSFAVKGSVLTVSSQVAETGDSTEDIDLSGVPDFDVSVTLNSDYVKDVLRIAEDSNVEVFIRSANEAVEVKIYRDPSYTYVVMPQRV